MSSLRGASGHHLTSLVVALLWSCGSATVDAAAAPAPEPVENRHEKSIHPGVACRAAARLQLAGELVRRELQQAGRPGRTRASRRVGRSAAQDGGLASLAAQRK